MLSAVLFALADLAVLALILLWLIGGGYVACGRAMSDYPLFPLVVVALSVGPVGVFIVAVVLSVICWKRLVEPLAE